jgi:ABC-type lipoprotein release transport system permease subunit
MTVADAPSRDRDLPGLVRLAWRSLGRQGRRTALLVIVVAYATVSILFFWGLTDGFLTSVFQNQARLVGAPVLITTTDYHRDPDPVHALPELASLGEAARSAPAVEAVAPRLELAVLLRSPYTSRGVRLRGVDPGHEAAVSDLPEAVGEGRMLERAGELVLGTALAEQLDVRVGERLAVDAASVAGPQALGLTVVGLVDAGVTLVDETTALAHLDDARRLSGVATATGLALDVPPGREAAVARALRDDLPSGVRAYGLMEQLGELARGLAAERIGIIPIALVFSLFAAIAVTSSVVVSVMERTREFGVMLSLGMSHRRLGAMVTLEAVLATLVGYGVGLVLGYALLLWMAQVNVMGPLFTSLWGDFLEGLAIGTDIRTDVRPVYVLYAGLTVLLAALGAVLTPARRVQSLVPAEAMRAAE